MPNEPENAPAAIGPSQPPARDLEADAAPSRAGSPHVLGRTAALLERYRREGIPEATIQRWLDLAINRTARAVADGSLWSCSIGSEES